VPYLQAALALQEQIGDNKPITPACSPLEMGWAFREVDILAASKELVDRLKVLLDRSRTGDLKAMEEIYELHKQMVFNMAYRHTYNRAAAEDILQDVFVKVFTHLRDIHTAETFSGWIYRIALNSCYSYLRDRKAKDGRTVALSSVEGKLDEASYDSPGRELRKPLDDAIEALSPRLRSVFVLHDVQGFKHEEIAKIMGCSVGTSKSNLFKARMKLRGALKGKLSEGEKP
jgi:RNA polymerase sigma-70 factor (ECF subfamily)